MRNIKKANIVYFTGTGGTKLVSDTLAANLTTKGITNTVKEISLNDRTVLTGANVLFLIYPVHAGDASEAVYNYIEEMDFAPFPMTDCVVLSVSAGGEVMFNAASRSKVVRKILKKGYITVYEDMLVMPNNFATGYSGEINSLLLTALPIKVNNIVDGYLSGVIHRRPSNAFASAIRFLISPFKFFAKVNGRFLKADKDCSGCGLCSSDCPRRNITIVKDRPTFGWKCVMCMRCIYACPNKSISNTFIKTIRLKEGFNIEELKSKEGLLQLNKENILASTPKDKAIREYLLKVIEYKS